MTKTVYKYHLPDHSRGGALKTATVPASAEVLYVDLQEMIPGEAKLMMWAKVDLPPFIEAERKVQIVVIGTGEESEWLDQPHRFINTFRFHAFVFHAFELTT